MKPITSPSKTTRRKATKLIQDAHDLIETVGFDINHYGYDTKDALQGEQPEPMCYIGTMRFVSGLDPEAFDTPTEGDGPELVLALATLDELAKSRLKRYDQDLIDKSLRTFSYQGDETGRFIERLGFVIQAKSHVRFPGPYQGKERDAYKKAYALKILRAALTKLYA